MLILSMHPKYRHNLQLEPLLGKINDICTRFTKDATKSLKGNAAAGARARKLSLEIEKVMKEFRRASVEADKQPSR